MESSSVSINNEILSITFINRLSQFAQVVKAFIIIGTIIFFSAYFSTLFSYKKNPYYIISLSQTIRLGLDDKLECFDEYRTRAYIILFSAIGIMVASELSLVGVYTTDMVYKLRLTSFFRVSIVVASLVSTVSWILALAVTIDSEGYLLHFLPAGLFFGISSTFRVIFLSEKTNQISGFMKTRKFLTYVGLSFLGISFLYPKIKKTDEAEDNTREDVCENIITYPFSEALLGIGEILLFSLLVWDRFDMAEKINRFHKQWDY